MVSDSDVIHGGEWLTVPEIMDRTGAGLTTVKRWLQDRELVGMRRGKNRAVMVPALFLLDDGPVPSLRGTVNVLSDSGFSDEEVIGWLHQPDDTLTGGSAIASLRSGAKTEVRRRAQEVAF